MHRPGLRGRVARVTLFAALALWPQVSHAGENDVFGATPYPALQRGVARRAYSIPPTPGVFRDAVRVYNRTGGAITVSIYPAAASVGKDGVVSVGFPGARLVGLAARIRLSRSTVKLPPHADAIVRFTARLDGTIPPGSLAGIVVEGRPQKGAPGFDLVQRIALLARPVAAGAGAPPAHEPAAAPRGGGEGFPVSTAAGAALFVFAGALALRMRPRRRASGAPRAAIGAGPVASDRPARPIPVPSRPAGEVTFGVIARPVGPPRADGSVAVLAPAAAARAVPVVPPAPPVRGRATVLELRPTRRSTRSAPPRILDLPSRAGENGQGRGSVRRARPRPDRPSSRS
jgi:hypothetical protein